MATNTKTRTELKQFFVKNAIPTQGNFADLIDAQLNQAEDGVFKQPDQPLGVVAVVGEQRRALQLYSAYPAANPDWLISLNPKRVAPGVGNTPGFGVADGTGTTRLLLDPAGNLTVSGSVNAGTDLNYGGLLGKLDVREQTLATVAAVRVADFRIGHTQRRGSPGRALVDNATSLVLNAGADWARTEIQSPLTVSGAVEVNVPGTPSGWGRFAVTTTTLWGDSATQYMTIGAGGATGIMFSNPYVAWYAGEARASIRYGRSGGVPNGSFWDVGTRANNAFSFAYNGGSDHKLFIGGDGSVCIGTTTPAATFTVQGSGSFSSGVSINSGGLAVNGGGLSVTGSSSMGGSLAVNGPMLITGFTNARGIAVNAANQTGVGMGVWLWNANDSAHVIYSAMPGPLGKSPANANAAMGVHNNSHRMRFRTASGQGFLFENSSELAVVDIASDTGNVWARGDLTVAGGSLRIGDWTLESAGNHLYIKRGNATVARFSIANDRFNVFRDVNGTGPYFYYNQLGGFASGGNSPPP